MIKSSDKYYLPNLNGLRFIAAFVIIIQHIEQIKYLFGISSNWIEYSFLPIIGELAVVFFFVLSGFLITHLLIKEERENGTIGIKKFYIRRFLRIAPLYFLIVALAFTVLLYFDIFHVPGSSPDAVSNNLWGKLLLYALFLSNAVMPVFGVVPYAAPTWSIGTEEQFYLIWPVLIKRIKRRRIQLISSVIGFYILIKLLLCSPLFSESDWVNKTLNIWNALKIDCLGIGALFAVLLSENKQFIKRILNTKLFYLTAFLIPILVLSGFEIPYFSQDYYSALFAIIILNFALNKGIKVSLENKILNHLGKISYGLYLYHMIAIVFTVKLCLAFEIYSSWFIYPLSILMSILISSISFKYFEGYFLVLKKKFDFREKQKSHTKMV